ncbi:hypothetical protein LJC47_05090 [Desulfosarcina sp. OttesenSCG-928-B08]|nr:hypothetical protein [Desulfosarcina sp. OttesenSCG-928-B08]
MKNIIKSLEGMVEEECRNTSIQNIPVIRYVHFRVGYDDEFDEENFDEFKKNIAGFLAIHNKNKECGRVNPPFSDFVSILVTPPKCINSYEIERDKAFMGIVGHINKLKEICPCIVLLDLCLFCAFEVALLEKHKVEILSMKIYQMFKNKCILYSSYGEVEIGSKWTEIYKCLHSHDEPPLMYGRELIEYGNFRETETVRQLLCTITQYADNIKESS